MKYEKLTKLSIRNHPELSERWVQERIAEDPSILGLGDLILKDKERTQAGAGRLDLLLQDADSTRRYEVEIQLGKTIPLIAIQMKAIKVGDAMTLVFTTVLDVISQGTEEEDEAEVTDRTAWESKGSKESLGLADMVQAMVDEVVPGFSLKYNKHYIGLNKQGVSKNFISLIPKKQTIILHIKLPQSEETQAILDSTDMDVMSYDKTWNRYRIRLTEKDLKQNKSTLLQLLKSAYDSYDA